MGLRILIVEDDKHVRHIFEQLLTQDPALAARDPKVVTAHDGKAGVEALETGAFDLVVTDLLMPRMDGFQFCKELRRHKYGKTVPLIVTSAVHKSRVIIDQLRVDFGALFFSKPFQIRDLMELIRKLVGEKSPATTPDLPTPPKASGKGGRRKSEKGAVVDFPPPPDPAKARQGDLKEIPVARLFFELLDERATGNLVLQRAKVQKEVNLVHGTPVSVQSNLRSESLGNFLVARKVLDDKQHAEALEKSQAEKRRLGGVLVELGHLSEEELLRQLAAQLQLKITNVLRWQAGNFVFTPGPPTSEAVTHASDPARLVFTGLQKSALAEEIVDGLNSRSGLVQPTERLERYRDSFVAVFGQALLGQLPVALESLLQSDEATLVALDAALLSGVVVLGSAAALSAEPSRVQAAPATLDLFEELFQEGASAKGRVDAGAHPDDLHLGAGQEKKPIDAASEALRKEILNQYLSLDGKNYYELLGVAPGSDTAAISAAYGQLQQKFALERFAEADLGSTYAHLETIHHLLETAYKTLENVATRAAYDQTLQGPRDSGLVDAELLAKATVELLERGDVSAARQKIEAAVQAAPDEADYHALLGWTIFLDEGGQSADPEERQRAARTAWIYIDQAFEISFEHPHAHEYSGRMALAIGNQETALDHFEKALTDHPLGTFAFTTVCELLTRARDFDRLEKVYRNLLARIPSGEAAVTLWSKLGELYRDQIHDPKAAQNAFEQAIKLAPDDSKLRNQLARLLSSAPKVGLEAAQALFDAWRTDRKAMHLGEQLFDLHVSKQNWDVAWLVASALAARGSHHTEANAFFRRFKPHFLQRAKEHITPELFSTLRHPDDHDGLCRLLERTYQALPELYRPADFGLANDAQPVTLDDAAPFARVLRYVEMMLWLGPVDVYTLPHGQSISVLPLHPQALLVSAELLAVTDRVALGHRLGRACSYLLSGRALAGQLPHAKAKAALLAALSLALPKLRIEDSDGKIRSLRDTLQGQSSSFAHEVAPLVEPLLKSGSLNVSKFARALVRTADRIGFLLCGDLTVACELTRSLSLPGSDDELCDFALSEVCQRARETMGLSIAV